MLGRELEPLLSESLFLTHADYSYGGTLLFAALHKTGDGAERKRLEKLILDLPQTARFLRDEPREPMPSWLEFSQNKLLGALDEADIVLPAVRALRKERAEQTPLPVNREPEGIRVTSASYSDEELVERRGISLKDPANAELFQLREALKPFMQRDGGEVEVSKIEQNWVVIGQCDRALRRHHGKDREMARRTLGTLGRCVRERRPPRHWPAN